MAISTTKLTPENPAGFTTYEYNTTPAISQTNVAFKRIRPAFDGEIVAIRANARTVNSATVPEVRVCAAGSATGQNVLASAITPSAFPATATEGALVTNRVLRRFTRNQDIVLHLTTGGTAPVDLNVQIVVRPYPMNGEA
jgi:hypothetical protein